MGMFKKTEYNPICKVFMEVFVIARIPHFTVLIHLEKGKGNLVTIVVGSLTTWISVVTNN